MHQSNPANPVPRAVLKLKAAARKAGQELSADSPPEISGVTPSSDSPQHQGKVIQKPGAAWSDELKRRMQEEMDALASR